MELVKLYIERVGMQRGYARGVHRSGMRKPVAIGVGQVLYEYKQGLEQLPEEQWEPVGAVTSVSQQRIGLTEYWIYEVEFRPADGVPLMVGGTLTVGRTSVYDPRLAGNGMAVAEGGHSGAGAER